MKVGFSCSNLISEIAMGCKHIDLPSDICSSVTDKFDQLNISYNFYKVKRGWGHKDQYELNNYDETVILVSDLFNFKSINIRAIKGKTIILDLAHCSIETASEYSTKLREFDIKVLGTVISFGKGKYYRFGGGGILFETLDEITSVTLPKICYDYKSLPSDIVSKGRYTNQSTRVIVHSNVFSLSEINGFRSNGLDISDPLQNRLENRVGPWLFWVPYLENTI